MRKYTFVVFHQDYAPLLRSLQDLGVVHVVEKQGVGDDEAVRGLTARATRLGRALRTLGQRTPAEGTVPALPLAADAILEELDSIQRETERLEQAKTINAQEIAFLLPWGEVPVETISRLAESGIGVRTFAVPEKKFDRTLLGTAPLAIVAEAGSRLYLAAFLRAGEDLPEIDGLEEVRLPARGLSEALAGQEDVSRKQAGLYARLDALASGTAADVLRAELGKMVAETDYARAALSAESGVEERVRILQGWVPRPAEAAVQTACDERGVVTIAEDPQPGDDVPIHLKNSRFARLFEPITRLFSLPSYAELDLTGLFAPFFTLFFGFCLGDAGYGLVIMLASFVARFKVKPDMKPFTTLGMLFGFSTMLVGVLTGTLFGVSLVELPQLREYVLISDQGMLFNLALGLGLLQILFGMCVQVVNRVRQYGFKSAISTMGWIVLLLSIVGLAGGDAFGPEAGPKVSSIAGYTALFGVALILFFNDLKVNIFVRIGKGVYELYNITGVFGDLLSYVRLFALGISSGILGAVINQLSGQLLGIPVVGVVLYAVALVVGHTGNMLLGMLGSFVHPMRLTFVEFYKSAGFSGGGKEYKPLAAKK